MSLGILIGLLFIFPCTVNIFLCSHLFLTDSELDFPLKHQDMNKW